MEVSYHYPPEIFALLVETIPLLCKSKLDVIIFLKGAGVSSDTIKDLEERVKTDRQNINKYEIVRTCLERINHKGDSEIRTRREIVKRVVEIEAFSCCWDDDRLKAKGLVSEIRKSVNVKDSFTKMNQERSREKEQRSMNARNKIKEEKNKRKNIENIKSELFSLFAMDGEPHKRGKLLEKVLNNLFYTFEILVKEDFKRNIPNQSTVMEQVDGVVEIDNNLYIVEMKWLKDPIGVDTIAQHLVRLFSRADARAIFISANGFKETAIEQCRNALSQKIIVLCSLQEIVMLLEKNADLKDFLKKKIMGATLDKEPFLKVEI